MRISIVLPTLNAARTLPSTLDSIACQEFRDFECVVMDGGSSDGSLALLESYRGKIPSFRLRSQADRGIYDAMNAGAASARGEWLYFMGADDRLVDAKVLSSIVPALRSDVDFVYGNVLWGETDHAYNGEVSYRKLLDYNICHQAAFTRASVIERFGGFDTRVRSHADWDLNVKIYRSNDLRRAYVDRVICRYGGDGFSWHNDDESFRVVRERLKAECIAAGGEAVVAPPVFLAPKDDVLGRLKRGIRRWASAVAAKP
jgi:glycosyltransferase involved in cell wall biosynthesis